MEIGSARLHVAHLDRVAGREQALHLRAHMGWNVDLAVAVQQQAVDVALGVAGIGVQAAVDLGQVGGIYPMHLSSFEKVKTNARAGRVPGGVPRLSSTWTPAPAAAASFGDTDGLSAVPPADTAATFDPGPRGAAAGTRIASMPADPMTPSFMIPTYTIAALSLGGVVLRPWRSPEVLWALAGALALVLLGLVPWPEALRAIGQGTDVYLFLSGMMLLSALAEREGCFDFLAAACVARARGSPGRLFFLVYALGTLVTVFMSNDATAVVLTPAVLAVCRKARARPLPYLLACAFIANAASFMLPVSNPANLVVYGHGLPPLGPWLARYALPSLLSVLATYATLRWLGRRDLIERVESDVTVPTLSTPGRLAAGGVASMAVVLLTASAFDVELGLPALLVALLAWLAIALAKRESPWPVMAQLSWSILPLVGGLFVIVEGLRRAGLIEALTQTLQRAAQVDPTAAAIGAGTLVAFACNLMNNLPAGLLTGAVVNGAHADALTRSAVLIGIDLGPNLSVTGSLATILWLVAIRRRGEHVSAWTFLKTGAVAMPVALAAAYAGPAGAARRRLTWHYHPTMTSLRNRIASLWAVLAAVCLAMLFVLRSAEQAGPAALVGRAETETRDACATIAHAVERLVPASDDGTTPLMEVVVDLSLREAYGVEGGVWDATHGDVAYAYPTYEGEVRKTDVPAAEQPSIQALARQVAGDGAARTDARRGSREAVVIAACALPRRQVAWTLTRVAAGQAAAFQHVTVVAALALGLVVLAGAWLLTGLRQWSRRARRARTGDRRPRRRHDPHRHPGRARPRPAGAGLQHLGGPHRRLERRLGAPRSRTGASRSIEQPRPRCRRPRARNPQPARRHAPAGRKRTGVPGRGRAGAARRRADGGAFHRRPHRCAGQLAARADAPDRALAPPDHPGTVAGRGDRLPRRASRAARRAVARRARPGTVGRDRPRGAGPCPRQPAAQRAPAHPRRVAASTCASWPTRGAGGCRSTTPVRASPPRCRPTCSSPSRPAARRARAWAWRPRTRSSPATAGC